MSLEVFSTPRLICEPYTITRPTSVILCCSSFAPICQNEARAMRVNPSVKLTAFRVV